MIFRCNACGKSRDFDLDYGMAIACENELKRICRLCRRPGAVIPDVYFDGKPEKNLADDPVTGRPPVFFSKTQKARYLQAHGLMEAGDRVHGAPVELWANQNRKTDTSHEAVTALKKVKEMGRDNRRREYQRITKEGERHV